MILHAEHKALEPIKNVLRRSMVTNYNFEMELPIIYRLNYTALWGIIDWKITWYDIEYMPMVMDVESFHFDVVPGVGGSKKLLRFELPLIKFWEITAFQMVNTWFLPSDSEVSLAFVDFDFDFEADLVLNREGFLDPKVHNCSIRFGESQFKHDDPFLEFCYHQLIVFSMVVIENSSYFMGEYIFTNLLGPIMNKSTNHYTYEFVLESPFAG